MHRPHADRDPNAVVKDPSIEVGDYIIYNDFVSEFPADGKEKLKRVGHTVYTK